MRIGGVNPLNIGEDITAVGLEGRGQGHRGGIRATPAQSGDIPRGGNALKARDHHDSTLVKMSLNQLMVNGENPGPGVHAVGMNFNLISR